MNILFICSRNRRRSPTAEAVYQGAAGLHVRSAGVSDDAENPAALDDIEWADSIIVTEKVHERKLREKFGPALRSRRVHVLGIPDNFEFMEPELIDLIRRRVDPLVR